GIRQLTAKGAHSSPARTIQREALVPKRASAARQNSTGTAPAANSCTSSGVRKLGTSTLLATNGSNWPCGNAHSQKAKNSDPPASAHSVQPRAIRCQGGGWYGSAGVSRGSSSSSR